MTEVEQPTDRLGRRIWLGQRARVSEAYEHFGDWRKAELQIVGIRLVSGRYDITVKEIVDGEVQEGETDGFSPEDLEVALAAHSPKGADTQPEQSEGHPNLSRLIEAAERLGGLLQHREGQEFDREIHLADDDPELIAFRQAIQDFRSGK